MPSAMIQNGYSPENHVSIGVMISIRTDTQEGIADNIIKLFFLQIRAIFLWYIVFGIAFICPMSVDNPYATTENGHRYLKTVAVYICVYVLFSVSLFLA